MRIGNVRAAIDWCTCDWGGGSNYGPYGLKAARKIADRTSGLDQWDRQAVTLVFSLVIGKDYRTQKNWDFTIVFAEKIRTHYTRWHKLRDENQAERDALQ